MTGPSWSSARTTGRKWWEKDCEPTSEQTEPVLEFLKGAGYAFYEVEGADASPQAIARRIEN